MIDVILIILCIFGLIWSGFHILVRLHERFLYIKLKNLNKLLEQEQYKNEQLQQLTMDLGQALIDLIPQFREKGITNLTYNILTKEFGFSIHDAFVAMYSVVLLHKKTDLFTPLVTFFDGVNNVELEIAPEQLLDFVYFKTISLSHEDKKYNINALTSKFLLQIK